MKLRENSTISAFIMPVCKQNEAAMNTVISVIFNIQWLLV